MIRQDHNNILVLVSIMLLFISPATFVSSWMITTATTRHHRSLPLWSLSLKSSRRIEDNDDEFASFAATLDDDYTNTVTTTTKTSPKKASSSRSVSSSSSTSSTPSKWQNDLDKLMFDRTTTIAQRQILISDLFNANNEIRQSLTTALRDRTIDPLLTPTGKKLQDGTRAVAYQLQTDIIPSLTAAAAKTTTSSTTSSSSYSNTKKSSNGNLFPPPLPIPNFSSLLPPIPNPEDVTKFSNRLLNTVTNQIQKNMETFQSDLQQDPSRIPSRIVKQAEDIINEASNVFAETPIGLKEPPYTVIMSNEDYEIRDYPAYTVATTTMSTAIMNDSGSSYDDDDNNDGDISATPLSVADQGVAFNTLASYIFGANDENRSMEMTTPVTTTMSGEMRFYIPETQPPEPLSQDAVMTSEFSYDTTPSKIRIEQIPAARLAVRRFTGFVTNGEILRQKEALLNAIQKDSNTIEIDVPHGQPVKHIIFQYNPPYTIPVLRRNEIAVPVTIISDEDTE